MDAGTVNEVRDETQRWLAGFFEGVMHHCGLDAGSQRRDMADELALRVIAEFEKRGWGPR